jgi:hypothetical protein
MTGIATKLIASKLQVGTAACAIAVGTTLLPVAAHATPNISVPTAPVTQVLNELAAAPANLAEFNWWWFGPPNPSPPPTLTVLSTQLLAPLLGFFGNVELCLLGVGIHIGPYGNLSVTLGVGC